MLTVSQINRHLADTPAAIRKYAEDIIGREGKFSDNPNDAGGPTMHGVSLRYTKGRADLFDLDTDGDVDIDDIRLVSRELAMLAFLQDFYLKPGYDKLPAVLQAEMMDFCVNAGPARANTVLQIAVNKMRVSIISLRTAFMPLGVDGVLGPISRAATVCALNVGGPECMINTLVDERIDFYVRLAEAVPQNRVFLKGWINRANEFRAQVKPAPVAAKSVRAAPVPTYLVPEMRKETKL